MNQFDINKIKTNLNVQNIQDSIVDNRQQMHIEITITNACNLNCKYCFEHDHSNKLNLYEEDKQLSLIKDLCENFNTLKFNQLQIVFWGGEPMLNLSFIYKIIEITHQYQFVNYFMYSNGSLYDAYIKFINNKLIQSIKNRLKIQLSYDGDPINEIERGISKEIIINVARLLKDNNFNFSFKATASTKTFKYIPNAWKSYEQLYDEFNCNYALTIDMTSVDFDKYFDEWKTTIIQILAYEYQFFKKYNKYLLSWLNYNNYNDGKMVCGKDYACHIHTNGNIYICHGCAYLNNEQKFIIGHTNEIKSLNDVLCKHAYGKRDNECFNCPAIYCNSCHIYNVDENHIYDTWLSNMNINKIRCQYFKFFGVAKKILDFIIIKRIHIIN